MHLGALPPAFAGLENEDSQEAAGYLQPFALEAGDLLMEQGEEDYTLAFIVQGSVQFLDGEVRIGGAAARDMIGEVELFGQMPRSASVAASAPTHLLVLAYEHWLELCERGNPAVYNIERFSHRRMSDRLRWLLDGIAERSQGGTAAPSGPPKRNGLMGALSNLFGGGRAPNLDPAAVLVHSPMFNWADPEVLQQIGASFKVERFAPRTVVCRHGEIGDRAFVIVDGQVDLIAPVGTDAIETIAALGPGMAFGDAALAQNAPRVGSCVCQTEVVALSIGRDQYGGLFAANDPAGSVFRQSMLRNLVLQLAPAQHRFVELERAINQRVEQTLRGSPVSTVWRD
ncbi:MAG: cyclic nucleotide-binding domain-containing protein [Myxococcota bacterium]